MTSGISKNSLDFGKKIGFLIKEYDLLLYFKYLLSMKNVCVAAFVKQICTFYPYHFGINDTDVKLWLVNNSS